MTEQQVPMLIRLLILLIALHQKELKPDQDENEGNTTGDQDLSMIRFFNE